jgi:photosystem II stability/assembly factor-like uncharacterized protein
VDTAAKTTAPNSSSLPSGADPAPAEVVAAGPFAFDCLAAVPRRDAHLIAASSGLIRQSDDGGKTWGDEVPGPSQPLAISSSADGRSVLVAEDPAGSVLGFLSRDGGATFAAMPRPWSAPTDPESMPPATVRADGTLVARDDLGGLALSSDGGVTWSHQPLAHRPHAVVPYGATVALLAHERKPLSLFASLDAGAHWQQLRWICNEPPPLATFNQGLLLLLEFSGTLRWEVKAERQIGVGRGWSGVALQLTTDAKVPERWCAIRGERGSLRPTLGFSDDSGRTWRTLPAAATVRGLGRLRGFPLTANSSGGFLWVDPAGRLLRYPALTPAATPPPPPLTEPRPVVAVPPVSPVVPVGAPPGAPALAASDRLPPIPAGTEAPPEVKPAKGATPPVVKLRYERDAVFTTPGGQRYLVRFAPFREDPRFGVRGTIHSPTTGGWAATPAQNFELFEWQALVEGKRKYDERRSKTALVFPDGAEIGWSYGGGEAGWFYNGQDRFRLVEIVPSPAAVSF